VENIGNIDSNFEVLQRVLALSETTLDALENIHKRTQKGKFSFQCTVNLFSDVVESFYKMENALKPFMPDFRGTELKKLTAEVVDAIKVMATAYEGRKDARPLEILQFNLLPRYRKWKEELEKALRHYSVS